MTTHIQLQQATEHNCISCTRGDCCQCMCSKWFVTAWTLHNKTRNSRSKLETSNFCEHNHELKTTTKRVRKIICHKFTNQIVRCLFWEGVWQADATENLIGKKEYATQFESEKKKMKRPNFVFTRNVTQMSDVSWPRVMAQRTAWLTTPDLWKFVFLGFVVVVRVW